MIAIVSSRIISRHKLIHFILHLLMGDDGTLVLNDSCVWQIPDPIDMKFQIQYLLGTPNIAPTLYCQEKPASHFLHIKIIQAIFIKIKGKGHGIFNHILISVSVYLQNFDPV